MWLSQDKKASTTVPMHSLEDVARVLHIFLVFCLQRSIKRLQ